MLAATIYDIATLSCKVEDVILSAEYTVFNGTPYVKCTIPSVLFLRYSSALGLDDEYDLTVEVSNDGV